MTIKY